MNRKLLVSLLRRNIEELEMITEGFMEMEEFPTAIVQLAKRKTEDIQTIIDELGAVKKPSIAEVLIEEKEPEKVYVPEIKPTQELDYVPPQEEVILKTEVLEVMEIKDETAEEPVVELIVPEIVVAEITVAPIEQAEVPEVKTVVVETINLPENITFEPKKESDEVKKMPIADKVGHQTTSRNEMLSRGDNSLGATLANKKISDIKLAISIGDRFRFQRELFKSNGEDMNKTLTYINQLATLKEAMGFLNSKYNWDEANEAVEDFYQIVKRKFA